MTKEQLKQRLELNSAMTQIAADYLRENACAIEREMVESLCHSRRLSAQHPFSGYGPGRLDGALGKLSAV